MAHVAAAEVLHFSTILQLFLLCSNFISLRGFLLNFHLQVQKQADTEQK